MTRWSSQKNKASLFILDGVWNVDKEDKATIRFKNEKDTLYYGSVNRFSGKAGI